MMQLCDEKGCWLNELDDVPAIELELWLVYYNRKDADRKKAQKKAEIESKHR